VFADDFKRSIVQQMEQADVSGKKAILRQHKLSKQQVAMWAGEQGAATKGLGRAKPPPRSLEEKRRIVARYASATTNAEKGAVMDEERVSQATVAIWQKTLRNDASPQSPVACREFGDRATGSLQWSPGLEYEYADLMRRLGSLTDHEIKRARLLQSEREAFNRVHTPGYAEFWDKFRSAALFAFEL
jgi:hypothetical protein